MFKHKCALSLKYVQINFTQILKAPNLTLFYIDKMYFIYFIFLIIHYTNFNLFIFGLTIQ